MCIPAGIMASAGGKKDYDQAGQLYFFVSSVSYKIFPSAFMALILIRAGSSEKYGV